MLISRNWLQKYIDLPEDITPDVVRRQFSRCVAEVEGYEIQGENFKNIVVGQIKKLQKHPNADSLQLCQVAIAKGKKVQIVCGGSNLAKDMFVAVALPGSYVKWHGEGDLIKLEKAVIRGEESFGMIAASEEIGLQDTFPGKGKEILDLSQAGLNMEIGQELADVLHLNDVIFEIENKTLSNRPDLWGHYGIAREFAGVFDLELKQIEEFEYEKGDEKFTVKIHDTSACRRFTGVRMDNVQVAESPNWLKVALESVGVRSINNIVDITNYVMLELGYPMHAFDSEKIAGAELHIRFPKKGEKLTLLDDTELELDESMLIVADKKQPLALAGIMGGKSSEVSDTTTSLYLECANFHPGLIRKTSTHVGLRTDASMRFEKSLDPYMPPRVIARAVELIKELCPDATVVSDFIDEYDSLPEPIILDISCDKIRAILGTDNIKNDFIEKTLLTLGFEILEKSDDTFKAQVPSWRATKDITLVEDVAEEILRMFGYDAVAPQEPRAVINVPLKNQNHYVMSHVKDFCSLALGMNEVYTYSFVSEKTARNLGRDINSYLQLENPIAKDIPLVRQTLLGNLLETTAKNLRFYDHFALYEIGRVFFDQPGEFNVDTQSKEMLPSQPHRLTGVFVPKGNAVPFYDAKDGLTRLLEHLHVSYTLHEMPQKDLEMWMHPQRSAYIEILNERVGVVTELHPMVAKKFGIKQRVGIFDIDFDVLVKLASIHTKYQPITKYPAITLDVSMIFEKQVTWQSIKDIILDVEKNLVQNIELFDEFVNKELEEACKKSLAFRITYQSDEKTLEQDEVQMIHEGILTELKKSLKGEIRS